MEKAQKMFMEINQRLKSVNGQVDKGLDNKQLQKRRTKRAQVKF